MEWQVTWRTDPIARAMADRHYSRKHPGTPQFAPPGRVLVLRTDRALWVTSWPLAEFTQHAWPGAWVNTLFRREGGDTIASELIRQAVAATRWRWSDVPEQGMITFINQAKVRHKRDPGRTYKHAGFAPIGTTKNGLIVWRLLPDDMPPPEPPVGARLKLEFG